MTMLASFPKVIIFVEEFLLIVIEGHLRPIDESLRTNHLVNSFDAWKVVEDAPAGTANHCHEISF
jgi:hypothetical protein